MTSCKIVSVSEYENGCVVHGRSQLECQAAEIEQLKGALAETFVFRDIHQKFEIYNKIRSIPSCYSCEKLGHDTDWTEGCGQAVEGAGSCDECLRLLLVGIQTLRSQAGTK